MGHLRNTMRLHEVNNKNWRHDEMTYIPPKKQTVPRHFSRREKK